MKRFSLHLTVGCLAFLIGIIVADRSISFRRTLWKSKSEIKHSPVLIQADTVPRPDEIPDLEDTAHLVLHRKGYSNFEYGYSISIPQGLVGLGEPAPFPQHGIGITLSKKPKSYVWLDGSYNSLEWQSLDQALDQHLKWIAERGGDLTVLKREPVNLQKLHAVRMVVRYKSLATNVIRVQDVVIAFRPCGAERKGITYTLGLITPAVQYDEDAKTFEEIINGWQTKQLPRT